ncbi:hypothetical protein BX666DRAFT_1491309 [Dichotomocladium elegans]|nr:hypothetical protein BX666DRAFT_1491309 [Dichotomocladium elegans]
MASSRCFCLLLAFSVASPNPSAADVVAGWLVVPPRSLFRPFRRRCSTAPAPSFPPFSTIVTAMAHLATFGLLRLLFS